MERVALNFKLLMNLEVALGTSDEIGAVPVGRRSVVPITPGHFEGPRLRSKARRNGQSTRLARAIHVHRPPLNALQSVLPGDVDWKPFEAFPSSVRLAVVVGEITKPEPYVIRVRVPAGVKLMPHRHPEDRIYTVLSGVFCIGLGDRFDGDGLRAYPPGSVIVLPGDTYHYHWARSGEYVTQVAGNGPLGLEYREPADDPRRSVSRGA